MNDLRYGLKQIGQAFQVAVLVALQLYSFMFGFLNLDKQ